MRIGGDVRVGIGRQRDRTGVSRWRRSRLVLVEGGNALLASVLEDMELVAIEPVNSLALAGNDDVH